jgi:hypothetical protein
MFNETHHLVQEFPQFEDKIFVLKTEDPHFKKLYHNYEALDKKIHSISQEIHAVSDESMEDLKKNRMKLKDELYEILNQKIA